MNLGVRRSLFGFWLLKMLSRAPLNRRGFFSSRSYCKPLLARNIATGQKSQYCGCVFGLRWATSIHSLSEGKLGGGIYNANSGGDAKTLSGRGVETARGAEWTAVQVSDTGRVWETHQRASCGTLRRHSLIHQEGHAMRAARRGLGFNHMLTSWYQAGPLRLMLPASGGTS